MNIITIILLVIAAIIIVPLIAALFMKKEHYVKREVIINAPLQKVFEYIRFLKNQDEFNEGAMEDSSRKKEYKGTDGTAGYVYSWSGDKDAGEGEKEIKNIVEGKKVEMEIRFTKPMVTSADIIMETESLSDNQTKVSWSNAGKLKYPLNLLIPMVQKHTKKGMDVSLQTLKNILEK